jgi:hypothetical protein
MFPRSSNVRLTTAGGLLLACCVALSSGSAAPPSGDRTFYTNQTSFLIPFTPDPGATGIDQVVLNVSEDYGKSYRPVATSGPTERSFKFTASQNGWYWFSVQTKDATGRYFPPNLLVVQPGLKVCVDTAPPVIAIKSVPAPEGSLAIEYSIHDDNPDPFTLRADYRAVGQKDWSPLRVTQLLSDRIVWTPAMNGPWEARVQMRDKAGNLGEQVANLTPPGAWQRGPDPRNPAPSNPAIQDIRFVNTKQFQLGYKLDNVGKSGLRSLDVWITDDEGRTHRRFQQVPIAPGPLAERPIDIKVDREGRYGFWVVPVSGVGLAEEPRVPSQPQVWIEVDTTAPVVAFTAPRPVVGTGPDANKVTIYYRATDRFLKERPITISYSVNRAQWVEVARELPNTGVYEWHTQESTPVEFFLRVEAVDEAGNVGSAVTPETVKVDASVPKAGSITVVPVKPMP